MRPEHLDQPRPRNDRVLHVVVGGDPAHRREGRLARLPDQLALGLVLRHANRVGSGALADLDHLVEARLAFRLGAVELDHERRAGIDGVAGVGGALGRPDREVVHHLDRARDHARRHDRGDHLAGLDRRPEEGHERAHRLRLGHDPQPDLGCDAERPLRADEGAEQVEPGRVELLAAQPCDLAVGEHELEAGHVVGGEAVLEAVRSARVLGDVAADRADDLRGGVGRVEVVGPDRLGDRDVRHARLDQHALVVQVDLEDAAHAGERDQHAVLDGQRAAGEARSPRRAPRTGTPARSQARTAACTSSVDPGSTTAPGVTAYWSRPSDSYVRSW